MLRCCFGWLGQPLQEDIIGPPSNYQEIVLHDGIVEVNVCMLGGRNVTFPVRRAAMGGEIKERLSSLWDIPIIEQKLIYGDTVVEDAGQPLLDLSEEERQANFVLIRIPLPTVYAVGGDVGLFGDQGSFDVVRLDTSNGVWDKLPPMTTDRRDCAAVVAQACLYIFGGSHGSKALAAAERFDPGTAQWERIPDMLEARIACGAASDGSKVFVMGGQPDRGAFGDKLATAEQFDLAAAQWVAMPAMTQGRSRCSAAFAGNMLHVVGGGWNSYSIERYDKEKASWEVVLPSMPTPRYFCAAAGVGNSLYIFGGQAGKTGGLSSMNTVERLDVVNARWEALPSMPYNRAYCVAAAAGGGFALFVFGGVNDDLVQVEHGECFNVSVCRWSQLPPTPVPRCTYAVASS